MDILIIKLGSLGDVINTLPLVINLKRYMHADVSWVVEPLSYPIVAEHSYVDHAILFDRYNWAEALPGLIKQLRCRNFDVVLDLQRIIKSALFCQASKAKRRIGFDKKRCKESSYLFPFERIPESDPNTHMVFQYLEFGKYLGIKNPDIRWDIPVKGITPYNLPDDYVVLNLGATKKANRWNAKGFADLAKGIRRRFQMVSVLTGASQDIPMAKEILTMADSEVIALVGKTSVLELKEVLAGSKVVVSCDTGPMHLASAIGKDVVALFGPSDPKRTGPFKGQVIQKDVGCNPCNARRCSNPICMEAITSDDVIERLEELWSA
ncbi:MAG: glycosyltransferase family 9 protein [Thermodesulfobacteriota bacterium]|nr:glycosyltransferase family 9 protein [Thermodesulfobacteriota bacterium]